MLLNYCWLFVSLFFKADFFFFQANQYIILKTPKESPLGDFEKFNPKYITVTPLGGTLCLWDILHHLTQSTAHPSPHLSQASAEQLFP